MKRILAALALVGCTISASAQDYEILGAIHSETAAAYMSDTYALILDKAGSDRILPDAKVRADLTHRFTMAESEFVIDHSVTVEQGEEPEEVVLSNELYQSYLLLMPAPWINLSFGRQRLNWGAGFTFSATDALHPRSADSDTEIGFDGASVSVLPGPDSSIEAAVAIQDALGTGDIRDLRTAVYASWYVQSVELGGSFVYQDEKIYRPGVHGSMPVGPLLLFGESAIEMYAAESVVEPRFIANAAAEYSLFGDDWDAVLVGEYIFNGLADDALPTPIAPRLTDNAGGFDATAPEYAYLDISFSFRSDWSTTHSVLMNLEDGSAYINHELTLSIFEGTDLGIGAAWTGGEGDTEFGGEAYPYHVTASAWVEVNF